MLWGSPQPAHCVNAPCRNVIVIRGACLLCGAGMLLQMESNIAGFAAELGEAELAARFAQHAQRRLAAIDALLWDGAGGQWRDLVVDLADAESAEPACSNISVSSSSFRHSSVVAASNWVPLYCGCAPAGSKQAAAAVASLQQSGLIQAAGLAVSLTRTGQQWDWPCSWPPITCMLLEGCREYGGEPGAQVCVCVIAVCMCMCVQGVHVCPEGGCTRVLRCCQLPSGVVQALCAAQHHTCPHSPLPPRSPVLQLAAALAQQYLQTAHAGWQQSGRMLEKFDALREGAAGGGGEYECMDGFGWTNGVALLLLERYGWQPGALQALSRLGSQVC